MCNHFLDDLWNHTTCMIVQASFLIGPFLGLQSYDSFVSKYSWSEFFFLQQSFRGLIKTWNFCVEIGFSTSLRTSSIFDIFKLLLVASLSIFCLFIWLWTFIISFSTKSQVGGPWSHLESKWSIAFSSLPIRCSPIALVTCQLFGYTTFLHPSKTTR